VCPDQICSATSRAARVAPTFALITADAERRFNIPRETIFRWWRDHPAIASTAPGGKGRSGYHLLVDPIELAIQAAAHGRLDLAAAATRFNVPAEIFAEHQDNPGRIGMLLALLPIATPTGRRRRRTDPPDAPAPVAEARHEAA
jgi:hypothetical protein